MRSISALKLKKPATASLWYIGTNIFSRVSSFIFTPIFTRILSPGEYSLYFLYSGWLGIVSVLSTLDLSGSVTFRALSENVVSGEDFFRGAIVMQGGLSILSLLVFFIFSGRIISFTSLPLSLFIIMFIQIFLNFSEGLYFAKKRYSYDYKKISAVNIISGIASPIIAIAFILFTPYKSEGRIFGVGVVSLLISLPLIFSMLKGEKSFVGRGVYRYIFKLAIPLLPFAIFNSVSANCDKIIVSRILGRGALGEYSLGHSMGFAMNFLTLGVSLAMTPWVMRKLRSGEEKITRDTLKYTVFLICGVVLLYLCALPEVISILAPQSYRGGMSVVYPLSAGVVFSFLAGILTSALLERKRGGWLVFSSFIGAAFAVGVGILLALRFGYFGCAVGIMLSFAVRFLALYLAGGKELLDMKSITFSTLYLSLFAFLSYALRFSFTARVLLGGAIILTLIPSAMRARSLLVE